MALQAPVTLRASMGRSAMMTGAQTCVRMLNPAVSQTTLPYGMTRMGCNPAEERKREGRWGALKRQERGSGQGAIRKAQRKTSRRKEKVVCKPIILFQTCADVISLNIYRKLHKSVGDYVTLRSLHSSVRGSIKIEAIQFSIWASLLSRLSWEIKHLMSLSLVGNITLCELVIWRPEKACVSHPPVI